MRKHSSKHLVCCSIHSFMYVGKNGKGLQGELERSSNWNSCCSSVWTAVLLTLEGSSRSITLPSVQLPGFTHRRLEFSQNAEKKPTSNHDPISITQLSSIFFTFFKILRKMRSAGLLPNDEDELISSHQRGGQVMGVVGQDTAAGVSDGAACSSLSHRWGRSMALWRTGYHRNKPN